MNRRELRLGWRESSLAYLRNLQGLKDPQAYCRTIPVIFFFASPLFQNMWFQEIKDLTETAAQDLLRESWKFFLCQVTRRNLWRNAFLLVGMAPDCPPGSDFLEGFFTRRADCVALADQSGQLLKTPGSPVYFQVTKPSGFGRMRPELDRLTRRR